MDFNKFIFQAPKVSTYNATEFQNFLLYVPRIITPKTIKYSEPSHIPCLYIPHQDGACKIIVCFHGNAEDVGQAKELYMSLQESMRVDILLIEYPGYGIYKGKPSAEAILNDSRMVIRFLIEKCGISLDSIIYLGRSIGTGPACNMASEFGGCMLILISAYRCLKDVVKNLAARYKLGWLAGVLFADRFRNIDLMPKIKCPTFFIHGQIDDLIPCEQSQDLVSRCEAKCVLHIPFDMDHNSFDYRIDFAEPLIKFAGQIKINFKPDEKNKIIAIPSEYFKIPSLN